MKDSYMGYYIGEVIKTVKDQYVPDFDIKTNKYIVYVSSNGISKESRKDFEKIKKNLLDSKIFLISFYDEQIGDEYLGIEVRDAVKKLVDIVSKEIEVAAVDAVLVNEQINLKTIDIDPEKDPLILRNSFNYVHDKDYFENPVDWEEDSYKVFDEKNFKDKKKTSFKNPGKYSIYHRIKDAPVGREKKGLESNIDQFDLIVHRKPIADYFVKSSFDYTTNDYKMEFIDLSYDPDDKEGIIKRKFKYIKEDGTAFYGFPSRLKGGTYIFEYIVMDKLGAFSDIKRDVYTLKDVPDPYLEVSLKPYNNQFSTYDIPLSEQLVFYNIKTKYPYPVSLSYQWFYKNKPVSKKHIINIKGDKEKGEVKWEDYVFKIPTYDNGVYQLKFYVENEDILVEKSFDIGIHTEIKVKKEFPDVLMEEDNILTVRTNKYVDDVLIKLYLGTKYEKEYVFKENKNKVFTLSLDSFVPDDIYDYQLIARINTPNKMNKKINGRIEKISLKLVDYTLKGSWNYWNGKVNKFGKKLTLEPHRFLSLEEIHLRLDIKGDPDEVFIDMSEELTKMKYKNIKYKDLFGYTVHFPKKLERKNGVYQFTYILPLSDSTKDFEDAILRKPYFIKIILKKGGRVKEYLIDDINITGNTLDHIYLQPK